MYAFVRQAEALSLPDYRVDEGHLPRVYTEAVLASQAGVQQPQCPCVTCACCLYAPNTVLR